MNSSYKEILFEDSAREKLKKGINILSEVSKLTYGPKGRNVAMHKFGFPSITNDSNNLINEIKKSDPFVNMGISFGKQAANKMKDTCGDGTTTCLILLQELINQGFKNIAAGNSPVILKRGMEKALFYFFEEIEKMKKYIKT